MAVITELETHDIRFPTSLELDGSDAMNPDPDYSASYVVLRTNDAQELQGRGFVFTIGRGNDVQVAAIRALRHLVVGRDVAAVCSELGAFARSLTDDSQLRWLGPEKGVMHMAIGAVVNAAWDMAARRAGKPVWRFIVDMSPAEIARTIDFRYISDAIAPGEGIELLQERESTKRERIGILRQKGYSAYTTSPGWLGYSDEKLARLAKEAVSAGFGAIKLKVGLKIEDDVRRCRIAREVIGPHVGLAVDANQRWDVGVAIPWLERLRPFNLAWAEEPTSPDDVLGHATIRKAVHPVPISTGEHTQNRVIFKQLFQAQAIDLAQIDAVRVGGVNENLAILLMAAKYGVRVFPHGGGVGLCELVQHLAMADYVAISGRMDDRSIEYVDHLHQHFIDPVRIRNGRYLAPELPGFSAEMRPASISEFQFQNGSAWRSKAAIG